MKIKEQKFKQTKHTITCSYCGKTLTLKWEEESDDSWSKQCSCGRYWILYQEQF